MTLTTWLTAIRPKTLPASISPILVGAALALRDGVFNPLLFLLVVLCALFLQISVNLANDLFDGISGVDQADRIGPKRVLNSGLVSERTLYFALFLCSGIAGALGVSIVLLSDWILLVFGGLSLLAVFAYSGGPFPLASHGLGELTVFLFFGLLAVAGSYFAFTGHLSADALVLGCGVGAISAAIMLVNNTRDITTDLRAGKRTLAARLGEHRSVQLYGALLLLGWLCSIAVLPLREQSWLLGLGLAALLWWLWTLTQAMRQAPTKAYNELLAKTALYLFIYSVFCSIALVWR